MVKDGLIKLNMVKDGLIKLYMVKDALIEFYVNEDNRIKGAVNIPVADLRSRWKELNKEKTTMVLCSSGMRSSMGAAILKRHGFKRIVNVAGGMDGYINAGYSVE